MKLLLLVAVFVGLASAGDYDKKNEVIKHVEYNAGYQEHGYTSTYVYHGRYPGKCGNDGFYYNDKYSFIICSNGNAYTQKCAPGSENSGYSHYEYGKQYYYHDFCDVNLVDEGYAARHNGYYGGYDGYHGANHYDGYGYGGRYGAGYGDGYGVGYGYNRGYGYGGYDGYEGHGYHAEGHYGGHYDYERPRYYGYHKK